jgi:hypothetical protein
MLNPYVHKEPFETGLCRGAADRELQRQGCQMVCFQTQNPNLGEFWRALNWKMFLSFWPVGIFYRDLGYFMTFFWLWYHVPRKIWQPCIAPVL